MNKLVILLIISFFALPLHGMQNRHQEAVDRSKQRYNGWIEDAKARGAYPPDQWTEITPQDDVCSVDIPCQYGPHSNTIVYRCGDSNPVPTYYSCRHCGGINPPKTSADLYSDALLQKALNLEEKDKQKKKEKKEKKKKKKSS
jgi:hypothetical protein